jgi:flagellar hook-length control protein FliK
MADTSVALLNLLPGVPAAGTLSPGAIAGTDGLSFTALLSTEISQLGTATTTAGGDPLDLETTDATTDDTAQTAVTNPLALLLAGSVLLPTPLTPVQTTPDGTTTTATAVLGGTTQLPETAAGVPNSTGGDASRVESLRFSGPANPLSPATPTAVNTTAVVTPNLPATPVPNTTPIPTQPAPPPPPNTTPAAIEPTQVPPAARVVVPQTPVVSDRTQALPSQPVELRPVPVQPPVTEPERVTGLPPVVAGQQPAVTRQRTTVTPQAVPTPTDATFPDAVKQAAVTASSQAPAVVPPAAGPGRPVPTPGVERPAVAVANRPVQEATQLATPTQPTPTRGPVQPQGVNPEAVPATTDGSVTGFRLPSEKVVRATTAAFEPELKPALVTDGTQPVDSARVLSHTTPVASSASATPDQAVADGRSVATPAHQISDNWITHADVRSQGGEHEFHMRLDPPELGEVRVRVHSSGDGVRAELTVANDAVRAMIESQIPELRQRLQDGGVSVTQFDVTTNTAGGDSSARNPYRESQPGDFQPAAAATPAAKLGRTRDPTTAVGGLLDVTA